MNFDQRHVVLHALMIAAERFDEHKAQFGALAASLRKGEVHPLFANGEPGARAAERMAEQFERQAQECRTVRDELEREEDESDEE